MKTTYADIDTYISSFPGEVQAKLEEMRHAVQGSAPDALETIKYAMPTFVWKGRNLVHFAAFKNHIGFYPAPTGISAFEKELAPYKQGKGSVQFPHAEKLPLSLIRKIVRYRLEETRKKEK